MKKMHAWLDVVQPVPGPPGLPRVIHDEGNPLPVRTIIDMRGTGVTATDDGPGDRTVITIPGDAVPSVFTRTGAIVAQSGDYTAAQVTNAVSVLGSYANPVWITSYAYSKLTGVPSTFPPSAHSHDWADITGEPTTFPPSAHVHAAADVTSGVFAVARLGTGTPTSSVYLRGDGQWASVPIPADTVTSVFGRAGVVVAQSGDYAVAQVTGAVPDTRQVIAGSGLSGGGALSGNVTLSANIAGIQTPWLQNVSAANFALTNAPLFQSAADMVFESGGAERLRLFASGGAARFGSHAEIRKDSQLALNVHFDGSDWRYIDNAAGLIFHSGGNAFYTAAAGTAGAVATLATRLTFADSGESVFSGQVNVTKLTVGSLAGATADSAVTFAAGQGRKVTWWATSDNFKFGVNLIDQSGTITTRFYSPSAYTGPLFDFGTLSVSDQTAFSPSLQVFGGGVILRAADTALADAYFPNGSASLYINSAGNTLVFRVRYSNGTYKTGSVSLT